MAETALVHGRCFQAKATPVCRAARHPWMFALVAIGWLFVAAALVTEKPWLLAAAAPFLFGAGVLTLVSAAAWVALARQATAMGPHTVAYQEQVARSPFLRRTMGATLVVFGLGLLAIATLL